MEPRSQRWLNTSKSGSAPVGDRGTNPNSSTISRLRRDSCRRRFSRRLSSLASISSWTRAAAVLTPHRHHALAGGQSQTQGRVGLAGAAGAYGDDVFTAPYVFATCQFHRQGPVHRRDGREVQGAQALPLSRLFHMGGDDWREQSGRGSDYAAKWPVSSTETGEHGNRRVNI